MKRDEAGGQKGRPRKSAYTAACPTKSDKEEAECAPIKRKRGRPKKSGRMLQLRRSVRLHLR